MDDKEKDLAEDFERAKQYISKYQTDIQNTIIARGNILNGAIQEFNSFLALPPSSSLAAAIWDFSFGLLSTLVPMLKLGEIITQQYATASAALEAAKIFGMTARTADKAKWIATGALTKGATLAKAGDDTKTLMTKVAAISPAAVALAQHASRKPIFELIKELYDATAMCQTASDAVLEEWANRLHDREKPLKAGEARRTLQAIARGLLKDLPQDFSPAELGEIWTLYLWIMIGEYVKRNCFTAVTVVSRGWNRGSDIDRKFVGLNDNQQAEILDLFGVKTARGKIFKQAPIIYLPEYYLRFPLRTETTYVDGANWTGRMQ